MYSCIALTTIDKQKLAEVERKSPKVEHKTTELEQKSPELERKIIVVESKSWSRSE